jgi:hypothetical protein
LKCSVIDGENVPLKYVSEWDEGNITFRQYLTARQISPVEALVHSSASLNFEKYFSSK